MTTIADVAKKAGVSVATVSRVLNGSGPVRPKTAQRVYEAIEQLHYQPNLLARNFRKSETRVLLMLTPNMTNPYYANILTGIGDTATRLGYSAFICNTADSQQNEEKALDMLHQRRADGAILLASSLGCEWLLPYAQQFPLVQCSEFDPDVPITHVSIDNYAAACEVVDYLVGLGHQRIAHISSENSYYSTRLRLQGYTDSMRRHGLALRDEYVACGARDYSFQSGKAAAKHLLSLPVRPTALFCISDTLALGAVMAAQEMGLAVPGDVAVTGFDDVDENQMVRPYLTTVAQPCYDLGSKAALLLNSLIQKEAQDALAHVLPHKLVVRESAAPPPKT